ncbi:hypothetical protein [Plantactinospora sp. DSM 117369]
MATDDPAAKRWPSLGSWADVDPARYPFDPDGVLAVVRALAPQVPPAVSPKMPLLGPEAWDKYRADRELAARWNDAITDIFVDQYGDWAFGWHWSPGVDDYSDELTRTWDFWRPISTSPEESLRLVAAALVEWRRWLEELAERFDRFLPALRIDGSAGRDDLVAVWEAAITHLLIGTVSRIEDEDGWQGWCHRVLTWFLTAAGLPQERSEMLVGSAVDARFDGWVALTRADIADIAERLAREIAEPGNRAIPRTGQGGDDWPDTWPDGWPSWRATNLPRPHS